MLWLEDVLRRGWRSHRPAVEVRSGGAHRTLSYADLLGAAAAIAADLTTASHHQRRVLIVAANSAEHVVADLAAMIAGAAATSVSPSADPDDVRYLARTADIVLCDEAGKRFLQRVSLDRPIRTVDCDRSAAAAPELAGDGDDARKVVVCPSAEWELALPCTAVDELLRAVRLRVPTGVWQRYLALTPLSGLIEQIFTYLTFQHQGTLRLGEWELADATAAQLTPAAAEAAAPGSVPYLVDFAPGETTYDLIARGVPVHTGLAVAGVYPISLAAQGTSDPGWVGEPLCHVWVKTSADGELLAKSKSELIIPWLAGGDGWFGLGVRGDIDADGRLRITNTA